MRVLEIPRELSPARIGRAVGEELRRVREARGWSRWYLAESLPSGIGERTVLSYEHGTRQLTVYRLLELGWALEVDAPTLFARGLQRARILVENMTLTVDLRALLADTRGKFRPMAQWARNALNEHPDGIAQVEPAVVRHLALFVGCHYRELAEHLARFTPDTISSSQEATGSPEQTNHAS